MDIPMLVILIGAIGGMMTSGIIGLFIGAVVLAVGYKLLVTWMVSEEEETQEEQAESNA
jgi:predicted PurR-regulated permease PerM